MRVCGLALGLEGLLSLMRRCRLGKRLGEFVGLALLLVSCEGYLDEKKDMGKPNDQAGVEGGR